MGIEKVKYGEIIDIVVVNNGVGSDIIYHPLHLHGNKFWVIADGPLPYPGSVRDTPNLNLINPISADTYPVLTGKYYVFRVVFNNPGIWHFHCHLLFHMLLGLQMAFNVAEEAQPDPPQSYFDDQLSF